jgi:hypothetical protein
VGASVTPSPSPQDYLLLTNAVYTTTGNVTPPPGWAVLNGQNGNPLIQQTSNGMLGIAFVNTTTQQVVVAFEETNLSANVANAGFLATENC